MDDINFIKLSPVEPLKLSFIGGGDNSSIGKMHFLSSQLDKKFKVVSGFFSRNNLTNIKSGNKWNINKNRIYNSIENLIKHEKDKIDAFVILLPTPNHFDVLKKLIKENLTIICEKPIVSNLNEAEKIYKLIKKLKFNKLFTTYNYTGYPMVREIKEIIRKKKLGKLLHFNFEMPQDGFLISKKKNKIKQWRMTDSIIPTIFLDLGIHLFNLSVFLIDKKPKKIITNYSHLKIKKKIVDNVKIWLSYDYNTFGSFWFSKSSLGNRNSLSLKLFFEKGSIYWNQKEQDTISMSLNDGSIRILDRSCKLFEANKERYNRYSACHPINFSVKFFFCCYVITLPRETNSLF